MLLVCSMYDTKHVLTWNLVVGRSPHSTMFSLKRSRFRGLLSHSLRPSPGLSNKRAAGWIEE